MSSNFTQIKIYRINDNSPKVISCVEMQAVLMLFNTRRYAALDYGICSNYKYHLDEIREELRSDGELLFSQKRISEKDKHVYHDNCHSLVRKIEKRNIGLRKVSGYLIDKNDIQFHNVKLISHSVAKNISNGNLIELTLINDPSCYHFIEHYSGSHGNDLLVSK